MEVQVDARENDWTYSPDMKNYPVIIVFGGGRERSQTLASKVFVYETTIFGQGLHQCRLALRSLSEGEDEHMIFKAENTVVHGQVCILLSC